LLNGTSAQKADVPRAALGNAVGEMEPATFRSRIQCSTTLVVNTWNDDYVIMVTTVTGSMLEVYLLQKCNVVNLHVFADCCVWNYTPVEKHGLRITLA